MITIKVYLKLVRPLTFKPCQSCRDMYMHTDIINLMHCPYIKQTEGVEAKEVYHMVYIKT